MSDCDPLFRFLSIRQEFFSYVRKNFSFFFLLNFFHSLSFVFHPSFFLFFLLSQSCQPFLRGAPSNSPNSFHSNHGQGKHRTDQLQLHPHPHHLQAANGLPPCVNNQFPPRGKSMICLGGPVMKTATTRKPTWMTSQTTATTTPMASCKRLVIPPSQARKPRVRFLSFTSFWFLGLDFFFFFFFFFFSTPCRP